MKLIHLSDLHLGKRVNEFSMLEDQRDILEKILHVIDRESADAVLIAGDIYDKSLPPAEAVELFDDFLVRLSARAVQVFAISGNHDSPERLAFGNRLMDQSGIHLSPVYSGEVTPFSIEDEYGTVYLYMLPFLKPATVRRFFPEKEITNYTEAVAAAVSQMEIDTTARNVLLAHQFVTGASRSESEEISVGGIDNVDAAAFAGFDYVALGHIHGPQNIGSERMRYCGTPLPYSFSEAKHKKSVTVVELGAKGELAVREVPLAPLHEMVELRGGYQELAEKKFYEGTTWTEDYVHITLTDEEAVFDAIGRLRGIYHNLMKLDYDNRRTRHRAEIRGAEEVEQKRPLDLFAAFYTLQNNGPLSQRQRDFMEELMERVWEEEP